MTATRKALVPGLLLAGLIAFANSAWAYSAGRFTRGNTGGEFPGELVCTRCHQGNELNSGSGTVGITVGETPAAEYTYTPGETVSLIISLTDENAALAGFQLTLRSGEGCGQPGTLAAGPSDAGSTVKTIDGTCNGSTVQWAAHNRPAIGPSATWDVAWTPPAEGVGPVAVALAVNAANGNRNRTGDTIYTYTATIEQAGAAAPPMPPAISDGGVVLADRVSETTTGAPNALAAALGTGFTEAEDPVSGTVDDAGRISTSLSGTCVEVNQHRAPIIQVAPEEVTFQIPSESGIGVASVQVIRGCDADGELRSNSAMFQIAAVQPVFFQFSESPPGVSALHADLTLVAAADSIPGRVTRPAVPGDFVTFFGTGFGRTVPALETGEIAVEPHGLAADSFRPMIGEMEVPAEKILYAGAALNFAGLYQLTFQVPDTVAAGSHAFSVLLDGVASADGPMLEVGDPADAMPTACTVGLVVMPDSTCEVMVGESTARFEINDDGQGCLVVGMDTTCGDQSLSAEGVEAAKNDNGSWTIGTVPAPPEPSEDMEIPNCEADMVIRPGGICKAVILGIQAFLEITEEGEACAKITSPDSACILSGADELDLSAYGAEIEKNEDNSWTVVRVPPPPSSDP